MLLSKTQTRVNHVDTAHVRNDAI